MSSPESHLEVNSESIVFDHLPISETILDAYDFLCRKDNFAFASAIRYAMLFDSNKEFRSDNDGTKITYAVLESGYQELEGPVIIYSIEEMLRFTVKPQMERPYFSTMKRYFDKHYYSHYGYMMISFVIFLSILHYKNSLYRLNREPEQDYAEAKNINYEYMKKIERINNDSTMKFMLQARKMFYFWRIYLMPFVHRADIQGYL